MELLQLGLTQLIGDFLIEGGPAHGQPLDQIVYAEVRLRKVLAGDLPSLLLNLGAVGGLVVGRRLLGIGGAGGCATGRRPPPARSGPARRAQETTLSPTRRAL